MECCCEQCSVTNCRCDVSAFDLRRLMCRPLEVDVSTFDDDVSTFGDGCVDLRRSMCPFSKIDVSTFGDRCQPSKIDGRCVDLRRWMIDVKLCCYTCSIH